MASFMAAGFLAICQRGKAGAMKTLPRRPGRHRHGAGRRPRPRARALPGRHGARVVVNDVAEDAADGRRRRDRAPRAARRSRASVTDEAAVGAWSRQARTWARVDILVNNAGILRDKSFAKMSLDDFRSVVDVHLMGPCICTKAVWELDARAELRPHRDDHLVVGPLRQLRQANYGAAKMALVGLMQTLAIEGEKYDIRVNCLAPDGRDADDAGRAADESLQLLDPALVSPGLLALVGDDAPTRDPLRRRGPLRARERHADARRYVGGGDDAGERVIAHWDAIVRSHGRSVPAYGFTQAEREVASAKVNR
jgi:NAD(P)-dependent dehydrogenase (short-subunit alcohol dehydrogenase family)